MYMGCDCSESSNETPADRKIYVGACSVTQLSLSCKNITDVPKIPY